MRSSVSFLFVSGALVASMACAPAGPPPAQEAAADPCEGLNTLADAEKADGWELLFDGKTMDGWHGYNAGDTEFWSIEDCALKTAGTEDNYGSDQRVDLTTDGDYRNFEITVDWKATTAGNSGLLYGAAEDPKYTTGWETGPEYQFVDDEAQFADEEGNLTDLKEGQKAGANYAMHPANDQKDLKPVGEWNTTKLVVNGPHVEHWLNGKKILEFERWTDEWKARRDASKWGEYKDYGLSETGRIVLQDHGSEFWFRNIKIREIGGDSDEAEESEE